MSDSITVLRCARGLRLAKLITPTGAIDYDRTRTFDGWTIPVDSLDAIEDIVRRLIDKPRLCVVRGALARGDQASRIRRLAYLDAKTGAEPTLQETPHKWLALDVEGVQQPTDIPPHDLEACARFAMQRLPVAFRRASCIVQATAGHGRKPDIRLRLWFWLSRHTTGAELKRWLTGSPADPSVFRPAQVIYTAAPVFQDCDDHLPRRIGSVRGSDTPVQVPAPLALAPAARREAKPLPGVDRAGASSYAWAALRNAKARVAGAAINNRHPTCVQESRGLARLVEAGLLNRSQVIRAMGEALEEAGKTRDEGEAIAEWGLSHPSAAQLPGDVANARL